jgi:glutamine transport system ATP-binding protein
LATEGMTMIVVTHEMVFAKRVGSRLLFMDGGQLVHDVKPIALLSDPPSERFREFLKHVD